MNPKVSFIIAAYQTKRKRTLRYFVDEPISVSESLSSISNNVLISHETIMVVNNVRDQSLIDLAKDPKLVTKYCLNSVNVGVARSWNMGAMMAEGDHLCWVNDDVVVGPGAIECLSAVLDSDTSIGQVGPAGALRNMSGPRIGIPEKKVGLTRIEDAHEISGYLFMIKNHVFWEIGGFDVKYTPAFYEETDISFAIRSRGYRCLVVPGLDIKHSRHGVSGKKSKIHYLFSEIDTDTLTERNHKYFINKWFSTKK